MTLKLYFMKCPERKISQCILPFKYFAKFTGNHLCQGLFFNKVVGQSPERKEKTVAQVFFCEFCEIFRKNFFTDHLRTTASGISY